MHGNFISFLYVFLLFLSHHLSPTYSYNVTSSSLSSPPSSSTPSSSSRLEVHFEVCLGMFNQYKAVAGALWLIAELATRKQQQLDPWIKPMHVVLPQMYRMLGREDAMIHFDEFFNVSYLQAKLLPFNITVSVAPDVHVVAEQRCPNIFWVRVLGTKKDKKLRGTRFRTIASLLTYTLSKLRQWTSPCILFRVTGKCTLNMGYVAEEKVFVTGHTYLRFANRLHQYAVLVRRKLGPYISLHLRTEQDMLQTKIIHFFSLESCLRRRLGKLVNQFPIYLAAGNVVFEYPEYLQWKAVTQLKLYNKSDFISNVATLQLGREEWAAVEADILVGGDIFIGYAGSSMTEYIVSEHHQVSHESIPLLENQTNSDRIFMWNQHCSNIFTRRSRRTHPDWELQALSKHIIVKKKQPVGKNKNNSSKTIVKTKPS